MKVLLTGAPRSGKSTLVRRLVGRYPGAAGGFLTAEVLRDDGRRCGLELLAIWRAPGQPLTVVERAQLAGVSDPSPVRVGRYGVSPAAVDLAVRALDAAMHEGALVVIDEIGPMQSRFEPFRDAVRRCLDSRNPMVATLAQGGDPFLDEVRSRPGARVVEVTRANRCYLPAGLLTWLCVVDGRGPQ